MERMDESLIEPFNIFFVKGYSLNFYLGLLVRNRMITFAAC